MASLGACNGFSLQPKQEFIQPIWRVMQQYREGFCIGSQQFVECRQIAGPDGGKYCCILRMIAKKSCQAAGREGRLPKIPSGELRMLFGDGKKEAEGASLFVAGAESQAGAPVLREKRQAVA
jgi:hypothetical protein